MFAILPLLSLLVPTAEPELKPGTQFHYQGSVSRLERDGGAAKAEKNFDLTVLVTGSDADGPDYVWLLDERGAGGFAWTDRFGRWSQNADGKVGGAVGPGLLFDYGGGTHVVPLLPPWVPLPDDAAVGTKWEREGLEYEVERATNVAERRGWEIEARNQYGTQQKMVVAVGSGVVLNCDDREFMNQGTEYRVEMRLVGTDSLDAATAKAEAGGVAALINLRSKLKRAPRVVAGELTAEQLSTLAALLPAVKSQAKSGVLSRIVATAERDLTDQSSRTSSLEELAAKQLGRKVEAFSVTGLGSVAAAGEVKLTDADLRDHVTVLHFWEYRDTPLVEPYGQVGYLEFLYGRRKDEGLRVVGVAVDGRFHDPKTALAAASGVRRLKTFMNLTYPIVHDGGELIHKFGDPRTVGGTLPLFVVVGRDGTIVHYKTGHYEVDREAGLKQLDTLIAELLAKP